MYYISFNRAKEGSLYELQQGQPVIPTEAAVRPAKNASMDGTRTATPGYYSIITIHENEASALGQAFPICLENISPLSKLN